jgi:peroxiredoxin
VSLLRVGEPAPDATLLGADEAPLRLSELWSEGPLVLIFLRHFG